MPLQDTKTSLCTDISTFISERILAATCAVADGFQSLVEPGDCLMVFGKSTAVLRALLQVRLIMDDHYRFPHEQTYICGRVLRVSVCISLSSVPSVCFGGVWICFVWTE